MSEEYKKINVRQLISKYESLEHQTNELSQRHRAKSLGNLMGAFTPKSNLQKASSTISLVQFGKDSFQTLDDVEKALIRLETHLNYYITYDKERHIQFQNQLFDIFACILTFGEEGALKKAQLKETVQQLFVQLNDVLPVNYSGSSYKKTSDSIKNGSKPEVKQNYLKNSFTNGFNKFKDLETKPETNGDNFWLKSEVRQSPFKKLDVNGFNKSKDLETKPEVDSDTFLHKPEVKQEQRGFNLLSVSKLRSLFEEKDRENSNGLGNVPALLPVKPNTNPEVVHQTNLYRKWNSMSSYSEDEDQQPVYLNTFSDLTAEGNTPETEIETNRIYESEEDEDEINENSLPRIMEENVWAEKEQEFDGVNEANVDEEFDRIYQEEGLTDDHLDRDSLE